MNNRYLYRAKRIDNGEWIVGSLIRAPYLGSIRSWISSEQEDKARLREISSNQAVWRAFEVRTDTICQCTGLKDKNGKLIWENDIVKVHDDEEPCLIEWGEDTAGWNMTQYDSYLYDFDNYWSYEVEVIGSAIDNLELLEV